MENTLPLKNSLKSLLNHNCLDSIRCAIIEFIVYNFNVYFKNNKLANDMTRNTTVKKEYDLAIQRMNAIRQIKTSDLTDEQKTQEAKQWLQQNDKSYFSHKNIIQILPREKLWMLGVDAKHHQFGATVYDKGLHRSNSKEPGYLDATETAIAFILRTLGNPLTTDFIKMTHHIAGCDVMSAEQQKLISSALFVKSDFQLGCLIIQKECSTPAGIKEMQQWEFQKLTGLNENTDPGTFYESLEKNPARVELGDRDMAETHINNFITGYNDTIQSAQNDDEKILAIATFARKFDYLHPFTDGNIRTARLLMLKMCIENNLTPTMMNDPNILDGHSTQEVAQQIKAGQETYKIQVGNWLKPTINQFTFFANSDSKKRSDAQSPKASKTEQLVNFFHNMFK